MGRVCNDFRLNYPLSHHQRIQSCAFLLQGAKQSANTAILETKLGIEITAIKNLIFFNLLSFSFKHKLLKILLA